MRYLTIILLCSFGLKGQNWQYDKTLHYFAGMGISVATGEIALQIKDNNAIALSSGFIIGSCAGVVKEVYDRDVRKTHFDVNDALTTAWGACNGMIVLRVAIDLREKKTYLKNTELYEGLGE